MSEVVKAAQSVGEKLFKELNLYTIWFAIWLIEAYYLMINVFYKIFINISKVNIDIPNKILQYNEDTLVYLSRYSSAILLLSLIVFSSGILLVPIKFMPKLGDYILIQRFAGYGIRCGFWLFLIWFTHSSYKSLNVLFLFFPWTVLFLFEGLKKIEEVLKEKYDITFRG